MRIALAQINPTIGDFSGNREKIRHFIHLARTQGASLIIFPELALTGYPPQDLLLQKAFVRSCEETLDSLLTESNHITILVGCVESNPGEGRPLFNIAAVLQNGRVVHKTYKRLLPTYDVFDEDRYFEPGPTNRPWIWNDIPFGITICEDAWNDKDYWKRRRYRKDPVAELIRAGARILINISASPFHLGKITLRNEMLRSLAVKYKVPVIMVNTVGANDDLLFDGSSCFINERGDFIYAAPSFCEDLGIIEFGDHKGKAGNSLPNLPSPIEQVHRALSMGIEDYVRKCGFHKVLIAVSGGIDSAVTAALATRALGAENVTGVFMPSPFTSENSFVDARQLAKNLGIRWIEISITPIFECFRQSLRTLYKEPIGVTEENLQARIRSNILMALSNQWNALVLSTGNKSELALGYCTLYGDMTGGLAVLGDVPKTLVYELARYINQDKEIIPENILEKPPSAELRKNQKDEDDIPPYSFVDPIIRMYIEEDKSLSEIIESGVDASIAKKIIQRIDRNEFKRRQAPLTLKVTSRAFGSGRKVPIAHQYHNFAKD